MLPSPRRRPRGLLGAGLVLLGAATFGAASGAAAQGTPRSVGECERLKNDLAYNQCLAMFGPAAKNVAGGYVAGGSEAPAASTASGSAASGLPLAAQAAALPQADEAEEARPARRGRFRMRRGRQSAVFTAGGSDGPSYRRRRRR